MKLRTALPAGLTNRMCERADPDRLGGLPPIRFVPAPTAKQEDGEETDQVKITISSEVSKYYPVFKEGTAEDVINLIRVHEGIVTDKKLVENCETIRALFNNKKKRLAALPLKPLRSNEQQEEAKELHTAMKEYNTQIKQVQGEAFDFFEKLLDQTLVTEWREIVKQECLTVDYIDLLGVKNTTGKRGKTFLALTPCYYKVMLLVCDQDAAERVKRYMTTNIRKADVVSIVQLCSRLQDMNAMIQYLPCLKNSLGSPADMPTMNKKFSELEMCTNLISTLPMKMSTAYYASKGKHFPTDFKKLEEDLILTEAQVQRQDKLINELRSKAGLPVHATEGKKKQHMKATDSIPKKQKGVNGKPSLLANTKKPLSKLCQLCAKGSPQVKNTHNTAECRKWNADGTEQRRAKSYGYSKNTNAHAHDGENLMEAFALMRKEIKALKKITKRKSKKHNKKRKSYDTSDDSSDSDSE